MRQRPLGTDGPLVSAVGLGAMSFAGAYGGVSEETAHAVLDAALELGITHLDTANIYGNGRSEEIIGRFLAARPGARHRLAIATKAGIGTDPATGARRIDNSPEHLATELEGSLRRLGIEAADLFYVHRRQPEIPIEEVAGTLSRLVEAGKARAIGFSEIAPSSLRRAAAVTPVAAVQSEYSLATRAPDLGLVQACAGLGTALVAFSPVGRSLLTDSPAGAERIGGSDFLSGNPRFRTPNLEANIAATEGFRRLAAELGTSAAALAIAWVLSRGSDVIALPGTGSPAHLRELVAGEALRLTAADHERISEALPPGWAHGDRYSDAQWIGPERYG